MATVHTQVGGKVMRRLSGNNYHSKSLRVRDWKSAFGKVHHHDELGDWAQIPQYDFDFIHAIHHLRRKSPETVVLASWHLVGHEWGHYFYFKSGKESHSKHHYSKGEREKDADNISYEIMEDEGFSEREVKNSKKKHYRKVCKYYHENLKD